MAAAKAKSDAKPKTAAKDKVGSPGNKDAQPMAAATAKSGAEPKTAAKDKAGSPSSKDAQPMAAAATKLMEENNNEKDESPDSPAEDERPDDTMPLSDLVAVVVPTEANGDEVMENKKIPKAAAAPDAAATGKAGSFAIDDAALMAAANAKASALPNAAAPAEAAGIGSPSRPGDSESEADLGDIESPRVPRQQNGQTYHRAPKYMFVN